MNGPHAYVSAFLFFRWAQPNVEQQLAMRLAGGPRRAASFSNSTTTPRRVAVLTCGRARRMDWMEAWK